MIVEAFVCNGVAMRVRGVDSVEIEAKIILAAGKRHCSLSPRLRCHWEDNTALAVGSASPFCFLFFSEGESYVTQAGLKLII